MIDLPPELRELFVSLRQAYLLDPAAPETPERARRMIVGAFDRLLGFDSPEHRRNSQARARRRKRAGSAPPP